MIKIKPLGGLGQIGSNLCLFETENANFLIDAGILFPNDDQFSLNYLTPNYDCLKNVKNIIITHGHEDHIGAIAHIIEKFPEIKIWAPPFCIQLLSKKLSYLKIKAHLIEYKNSTKINIGNLEIHPVKVNHSIPHTYGILINSKLQDTSIFYCSDFKIDYSEKYEAVFDFEKLVEKSSGFKNKILMSDSTNINSPTGHSISEDEVFRTLDSLIIPNTKRYIFTTFSSNIYRIISILEIAKKKKIKVVVYGRSIKSYLDSATDAGIIDNSYKIFDIDQVEEHLSNVIYIVSGCQGDFRSAFYRILSGNDQKVKLNSNDCILVSSKPIPGNEKQLSNLLGQAATFGAQIITSNDHTIHASGHACVDELEKLYQEFKPTHAIPIHGEGHFLQKHIEKLGPKFKMCTFYFLTNFDEFNIESSTKLIHTKQECPDPIMYYGNHSIISKDKIKERRKISQNGLIVIAINLLAKKSNPKESFSFDLVGIPELNSSQSDSLRNIILRNINDSDGTQSALQVSVRRYINNLYGHKPVILIQKN